MCDFREALKVFGLVVFSTFVFFNYSANAYVASSANYRIDSDVVSMGGTLSTSTSYILQSSLNGISSETSTSSSFSVYSGYLQMATPYLAVSSPSNVAMSPAISITGGQGNGSASWTVTTDNSGGYSLSIGANTSPALQSATDSFPNYSTTVNGVPNYDWGIGEGGQAFGFSPEGVDIISNYKDDGISLCNTGSNDTADKCWDSIDLVSKIVSQKNAPNHPTGSQTNIKFRAESGRLIKKTAGSYSATITVTVITL